MLALAEDDPLRAGLATVVPAARGQDPSPARARIRETFDDITRARNRRVTWSQIAALLEAEGTRAADGSVLTPDEVKALYHAEKYLRASRTKRQPAKLKVAKSAPPSPARPEVLDPPPVIPTRPEVVPPAPSPELGPELAAGADKLRAALARKRQDIGEPNTLTFGAEDRRRKPENDEHG